MGYHCAEVAALRNLSRRTEAACAAALFALGFALRLAALAALPAGLNQDEASALYDAWAILNYGVDRNMNALPVLLVSWGSGQNALLSYLAMPFIALLGPTVWALRLPMALSGCLTLALFWALARRARGPVFALWALGFLALCPWHVMAVRWGLESNLLPAMLMGGVYFAALSEKRPWALLGAGVFFGLAPYAYGTAFFILPPLLLFCVWRLRKSLRPLPFLAGLGIFLALVLPIALCQLRNALGLPAAGFLGFTLPELTATRQSATSVFGTGLAGLWDNIRALARLLITQSDGLPWNSAPRGGILYALGLPLALWGLVRSLRTKGRGAAEGIMLAWLFSALACSALIAVNINRVNFLWLPLAYFAALGLDALGALAGRLWPALPAALLACFAAFFTSYCLSLGGAGNVNFFPGLGEAIEYVSAREPESAYITDWVNSPYIFALLYTETPPEEFAATVEYTNPDGAFRNVEGFANWRFGPAEEAEGGLAIVHVSEIQNREVEAVFGGYAVIIPESK